jgi:hypothetical protein
MVDVIHIHEDDWGMRNLYPAAAKAEAEKDIAEAAAAAERNRDPSGFGYTDVYMANAPSTDYTDVGLAISDVEQALASILPRVKRFNATIGSAMGSANRDPYGPYEEDAWCFGLGNHCYLKVETKGQLVSGIWFDLDTDDGEAINRFKSAVLALEALTPSIIADYFLDFTGTISEPGVLDSYLAAIEGRRRAAEQAVLEYRAQHKERPQSKSIVARLLSIFASRQL